MPNPPRLIVMGASGSGKTTIGTLLAHTLELGFVDADSLHPQSNVEKMAAGHPLDDADRWPWLATVGAALATASETGLVVACSALKRSYREAILAAAPGSRFVYLSAPRQLLEQRIGHRHGHFMPASLLDSQLATLEPLAIDEPGVTIEMLPTESAEALVRRAVSALGV